MNERGESGGGRRSKGEEKEIEKETMGVNQMERRAGKAEEREMQARE